jgi:hypothetical protein
MLQTATRKAIVIAIKRSQTMPRYDRSPPAVEKELSYLAASTSFTFLWLLKKEYK